MQVRVLTTREYLSLPQPPQRWVIDQLVPAQSLIALWGPPKEGKTTLALQAGRCVIQGLPFLGYETQRGPVLLLQVDTPRSELTPLLIRLQSEWNQNAGFHHPDPDQLAAHKPMNILDVDTLFYLRTMVKLVKPSMVIVDCFRELGSFKENISEEQRPIVNALKSITTDNPEHPCACLLIHHTSKLSGKEATPDARDAGRGSGYLSGAVDSIWFLHQQQLKIEARFSKKQTMYLNYDDSTLWSRR